jgi:DnaK suppressor protein
MRRTGFILQCSPGFPLRLVKVRRKMLKKADFEEFRKDLTHLRARVRGDVIQMTDEALDRYGEGSESKSPTHLAELGTENYEQDFALRRVENEQELLEEIDEALKRIELGTYGLCETCIAAGLPATKSSIPKTRLKIIPFARNCIECERKRERLGR